MSDSRYFVGLISGTSVDGVDAVVLDLGAGHMDVVASHVEPYPEDLREAILGLSQPGINEIDRLGAVDRQIAAIDEDNDGILSNDQILDMFIRIEKIFCQESAYQ